MRTLSIYLIAALVQFASLNSFATAAISSFSSSGHINAPADEERTNQNQTRSSKYAALIRAKTLAGLRNIAREDQRLEVQRVKCRTELSARKIPVSCFWVLERESELHLLPAITEMRDVTWLKKLCLTRVETTKSLSEVEIALRAERTPEDCQAAMRNRIADIRYQLESTSPQKLFEARFPVQEVNHEN